MGSWGPGSQPATEPKPQHGRARRAGACCGQPPSADRRSRAGREARRMSRVGRLILPGKLVQAAEAEGWQGWLATALPAALGQALQMWSLTVGEPFQPGGQTAWVAPARDASGAGLVLKIGWPHADAAHEADGLRAWAGNGAVWLRAAHDFGDATALLIEWCVPGTPLSRRPEPEQDTVVAALLRLALDRARTRASLPVPAADVPAVGGGVRATGRSRPGAPGPRTGPGGHRAVP